MVLDVRIGWMIVKQHSRTLGIWLPYNSSLWPSVFRMTSELNYQLLISISIMCLNLINPVTLHKNYLGQDFAELKYNVALTLEIRSGQSHLDSHIDFASTWLCPKIFHHWIKNLDSPTLKHNELLISYCGDLRSEDTYTHILCELLLIAECSVIGHI